VKRITSRDNPLFKTLVRLATSSRERRKQQMTLLDGAHLVAAYGKRFGLPRVVAASETGAGKPEIAHLLAGLAQARPVILADALFREIAPTVAPTGIVAAIDTPHAGPLPRDLDGALLLDAVQDPGNVGSILRSAAAAGVTHVLLSPDCAFAWAPRVVRAGMGAHFSLAIHEGVDLSAALRAFPGTTLALTLSAEASLYDADLSVPSAFLIGNEGAGLSPELAAQASARVRIPMPGGSESLNVAAAAAVCLFERVRQRLARG